MTQGIYKEIGVLAAIESKRHFGAVGLQVFRADSMPGTHDAALEKRERRFDRIGIDIALRVDAEVAADRFLAGRIGKLDVGPISRGGATGRRSWMTRLAPVTSTSTVRVFR